MAPKFAATKASPKKRIAGKQPGDPGCKRVVIPRVADVRPTPSAAATAQRAPMEAPIQMSLLRYSDRAADLLPGMPDAPLWQLQLQHSAKPSVTWRILANFNSYLQDLNTTDRDIPSTLAGLRDLGILLSLTGAQDPCGAGFVHYRVAFYVVGNEEALVNALGLIDGFLGFRAQSAEDNFPASLRISWSSALPLDPGFSLPVDRYQDPLRPDALLFGPFEACPPQGQQVLVLSAEFGASSVTGVFVGATWAFRESFEAHGITGARQPPDDVFVRVLPETGLDTEAGQSYILHTVLKEVLHGLVLLMRVTLPPPPQSLSADFLGKLETNPQIVLQYAPGP